MPPGNLDGNKGYVMALHKTVTNVWQWGDGTPLTYNPWAPGQPDCVPCTEAFLRRLDWKISDREDGQRYNFICEI